MSDLKPPPTGRAVTVRRAALALTVVALAVVGVVLLLPQSTDESAPARPSDTSSPSQTSSPLTDCAAVPSECGFPDATNTGVPDEARLRIVPDDLTEGDGWQVAADGGRIEVDQNGAVLENIETDLPVEVAANGVTVRDCRIRASGDTAGVGLRGAAGTTIENNEIGPLQGAPRLKYGVQDVDGDATGTRIVANEIFRTGTGIAVHEGAVLDNYLHDLEAQGDDHVNGVVSNGSTIPMEIRGNTILNPLDQTDAIALFQDFGLEANRVVADNLLAGGSYTIYAGGRAGGDLSSNIVIENNRFSRLFFPDGGTFGPATSFDGTGEGNIWSGNIWDDTGEPVSTP